MRRLLFTLAGIAVLCLLASCGGGSGPPQVVPPPGGNPTPTGPDDIPPTIVSVTGLEGDSLTGAVQLSIVAADNVAVAQVRLSIDGNFVASASGSELSFLWQTAAYYDGDHQVVIAAIDTTGNGRQNTYGVVLSNAHPVPGDPSSPDNPHGPGAPDLTHAADPTDKTPPGNIIISGVTAGQTVWDVVKFTALAVDDKAIWWIEARCNGELIASGPGPSLAISWDSDTVPDGPHAIEVVAYDQGINVARSQVQLVTDNSVDRYPPVIPMSFPRFVTVIGKQPIHYTFADDKSIASIVVELEGQEIFRTTGTKELQFSYDSTKHDDGIFLLSFSVTDGAGNTVRASQFAVFKNHPTHTVTGRILAPNGIDPLADVYVRMPAYVPSGAPDYGIPDKTKEDVMTGYYGDAENYWVLHTDHDGQFSIKGVPEGARTVDVLSYSAGIPSTVSLPLTVRGDTTMTAAQGTLPTSGAGVPRLAVVTGSGESVQNWLAKLGYGEVSASGALVLGTQKFTLIDGNDSLGSGYVDLPQFLGSPDALAKVDAIFICAGSSYEQQLAANPQWRTNIANWLNTDTAGATVHLLYCGGDAYNFLGAWFPASFGWVGDKRPDSQQFDPLPLDAYSYPGPTPAAVSLYHCPDLAAWLLARGATGQQTDSISLTLPDGWAAARGASLGDTSDLELTVSLGATGTQTAKLLAHNSPYSGGIGNWSQLRGVLVDNAMPLPAAPSTSWSLQERVLEFWLYGQRQWSTN